MLSFLVVRTSHGGMLRRYGISKTNIVCDDSTIGLLCGKRLRQFSLVDQALGRLLTGSFFDRGGQCTTVRDDL